MTFVSHSWIVCFDVKTETFRKIQFPSVPGEARGNLVVLNGCIHLCVSYTINKEYRNLWRMDGDGWVKMDDFIDPLYNKFGRQYICSTSMGNWLAILEENNSLKKMNAEDFRRNYWYFGYRRWEYRSSRMIYVETLVSPNP
ncbi:putative F-box associated domain, type 3 [Helianthus anomalus]